MTVPVAGGKAGPETVFAEGWLEGQKAWGRPVDVLVRPDGSLLVSDDKAGVDLPDHVRSVKRPSAARYNAAARGVKETSMKPARPARGGSV